MLAPRLIVVALLLLSLDECETKPPPEDVVCPADAMMCPDGSSVGRQGPDCEFAPCPAGCTKDAKLCPDGSSVGRQGPDCEFAPCPGS